MIDLAIPTWATRVLGSDGHERIETAIQLPVIQDLPTGRPETNYRIITGLRFQW